MSKELEFAIETAKGAGEILMEYFGTELTKKIKTSADDFATEADEAAEKFILDKITSEFPDDAIVAEESGAQGFDHAQYTWIVDPLDGTYGFAHGKKGFGVFIARAKGDQVELAVAFDPLSNVLAHAELGKGTFMNEKKVKLDVGPSKELPLSANQELHSTLESIGLGGTSFSAIDPTLSTLMGKQKAYVVNVGFAWDFAVPSILFSEAGWTVTNFIGARYKWDGVIEFGHPGIIAAPPDLHAELVRVLKK